ncbi:N-6 DNA methylase [Clostridium sp. YIM B02551]|uniref:N-6 DNA methylase n=1 Tax=Clostridium sp. YIM B02551 TaxID=2910679 RepID=UPI001EEC0E7D|nr:N-6 DNA methylase [Clostridium sp. YIM B02551]
MNKGLTYNQFYDVLLNLREEFHSNGRIDDSNAKLDEIMKILIISYYEAKRGNKFSLEYIKELSDKRFGNSDYTAKTLRELFEQIVKDKMFFNEDGTNIFGANPSLIIQESENQFADKLIGELSKIDFVSLIESGNNSDFDLVNECFGHFVRDNFRNNKEDGQYMTPSEVTEPVLDMVFNDILKDEEFIKCLKENNYQFTIMDPTCGVGTLIIEAFKRFEKYVTLLDIDTKDKDDIIRKIKQNCLIGQDKVDRMARLSKINMMLIGGNISNISVGNSIIGESNINKLMNKVDLIFNNPPFGAEYNISKFIGNDNYPILNNIHISSGNINSELAVLDKCISLLKPNGRLVIVVPDSVVSAKGIYEEFRKELMRICDIKAILELPAVTFAQAGTRTKTVIIYLQKKVSENKEIFMGVCNDVGYVVKERAGVPVKIQEGINEMYGISKAYLKSNGLESKKFNILSNSPSATIISSEYIIDNVLNPSFYSAERLNSITKLESIDNDNFNVKKLEEIVEFKSKSRKSFNVSDEIKHISVLHINPDSTIDLEQARQFKPISKGRLCESGDILFSKINPRIPRLAVIPEINETFVCSNEFEIIRVKDNISPYLLTEILKLPYVKQQVENLTSGTSSSHNRIKTEQLGQILIPLPKNGTDIEKKYNVIADKIEESIKLKYNAQNNLLNQIQNLEEMLA